MLFCFFIEGREIVGIVVHVMHHRACDEIFFFGDFCCGCGCGCGEKGIGNRKMGTYAYGGIHI